MRFPRKFSNLLAFFSWVPLGRGVEFSRKSKFESLCKMYLRAFCFQTITFPRNIKKKYISFFLVYFFVIFRSTPVIFISALWPSSSLTCWKLNIHWSASLNQGLELPNDKYMHTPPASHKIFLHLFMSFFSSSAENDAKMHFAPAYRTLRFPLLPDPWQGALLLSFITLI